MRCTDLFFPQHIADTGNYNTGLMHAMRSRFRQHIDASKLGARVLGFTSVVGWLAEDGL